MVQEEGREQAGQGQGQGGSSVGGNIVMISAALASHGIPNYAAMSAAKAAVEGGWVDGRLQGGYWVVMQ